ncbi:Hypothetical predicted protein [Xyrichtys novacula]|uniref:Uncharacterized protein n=1 Tax=Xyrichtys novacula TaxID=13765 RepID=A0AAV1HR83_XYRNO|nr:Hypothetical predicted protein [Xyrichtys novacula]
MLMMSPRYLHHSKNDTFRTSNARKPVEISAAIPTVQPLPEDTPTAATTRRRRHPNRAGITRKAKAPVRERLRLTLSYAATHQHLLETTAAQTKVRGPVRGREL